MKLALVIVSIIAVFTADCRDFPDGPEGRDTTDNVQLSSDEPEDHVHSEESQDRDFSDEDQLLKKEPLINKEEDGETESRLRRSKCKARNACVVMGGFCVTNATLCSTRLVPEGCKGTNCQCCIPESVNQCVNETAMKETVDEGNDNVTRALEIKINNLETVLQTMNNNVTNSIKESVNQCVDEAAMKETVNEGNDNITRALEIKIDNLETELQTINNNVTNSIKESINQCVDETAMKETVNEGNDNVTRALEIKINRLETELQTIKNSVTNSIKGCPKGFILLTSPSNQCLKLFNDKFRNYDAAKAKCQAEGMVIAKPYDPITLRSYLITRYGNDAYCWIGARGDGSKFRWDRDNVAIESNNLYWRTSHPGSSVSSSYCIRLEALNGDWVADPVRPYWRMSCTGSAYTLCELIME